MNLQRDRWTNSSVQKKAELSKKSGFLGGTTDVHFSRIYCTGCTADESSRGDPSWLGAQRPPQFITARFMSSGHTRFFVA